MLVGRVSSFIAPPNDEFIIFCIFDRTSVVGGEDALIQFGIHVEGASSVNAVETFPTNAIVNIVLELVEFHSLADGYLFQIFASVEGIADHGVIGNGNLLQRIEVAESAAVVAGIDGALQCQRFERDTVVEAVTLNRFEIFRNRQLLQGFALDKRIGKRFKAFGEGKLLQRHHIVEAIEKAGDAFFDYQFFYCET